MDELEAKHNFDIETMLLPVRFVETAAVDENIPPKLTRVSYLLSSSGKVISYNIPREWAKYIAACANSGPEEKQLKVPRMLSKIVIPRDPPRNCFSKEILQTKDGMLQIKRSRELVEYIRMFDKKMGYYVKTKHNFPITVPCQIKAEFHIHKDNSGSLCEFLEPLEIALYEVGILNPSQYNIIKSWDGSRVVYDSEHQYTSLVIREYV